MTARWRCFVAAPIDATARMAIRDAREPWLTRPDLDGLRWTDPTAWHLTLAFLGDVDAAAVPGVISAARGVAARHGPMRLPVAGVGAFPVPERGRVAWYAIGDPDSKVSDLARGLGVALHVETGEPFRPHITLARTRHETMDLRGWIADAAEDGLSASIAVDRIELMRSHLGRGPAVYETLASMPLTGASA